MVSNKGEKLRREHQRGKKVQKIWIFFINLGVSRSVLYCRYCLNGHPFEPDLFDMELPESVKQIIPGVQSAPTYASIISGTSSSNSTSSHSGNGSATQQQEELDFYDLFNYSQDKSAKTQIEYARNHVLGMLEVEPLHFTCHSASDGTKMERLDSTGTSSGTTVISSAPGLGTIGLGTSVLGSSGFGTGTGGLGTSGLTGTINFGESLPPPPPISAPLSYSLPSAVAAAKHQLQELNSKNFPTMKHKIMHIKQLLHEVGKSLPVLQKNPPGSAELMPSTPKTTPQVMTPPLTPPNEAWQQVNTF